MAGHPARQSPPGELSNMVLHTAVRRLPRNPATCPPAAPAANCCDWRLLARALHREALRPLRADRPWGSGRHASRSDLLDCSRSAGPPSSSRSTARTTHMHAIDRLTEGEWDHPSETEDCRCVDNGLVAHEWDPRWATTARAPRCVLERCDFPGTRLAGPMSPPPHLPLDRQHPDEHPCSLPTRVGRPAGGSLHMSSPSS